MLWYFLISVTIYDNKAEKEGFLMTYVAFSLVHTEPLVSTEALGPNTLSVKSRKVLFL